MVFETWKQPGQVHNSTFQFDFDPKISLVQSYENSSVQASDFLTFSNEHLILTKTNFDCPNKLTYVILSKIKPKSTIPNL